MEILIVTVFVGGVLLAFELLFFAWNVRQGSHDHAERLALLPLEEDPSGAPPARAEKGNG